MRSRWVCRILLYSFLVSLASEARAQSTEPACDPTDAFAATIGHSPYFQNFYLVDGQVRSWAGPVEKVFGFRTMDGKPKLIGSYPLLGPVQVEGIIRSTTTAYNRGMNSWSRASFEERCQAVEKFLADLKRQRSKIIAFIFHEISKNQVDAENEFDRTIKYIERTIQHIRSHEWDSCAPHSTFGGFCANLKPRPKGVVLVMGPSNYPFNETMTLLIPALLMGNFVIFKPAKAGVLLNSPMLPIFAEHFPAGVVNSLYGDGKAVVGQVMKSGIVNHLAFIGSAKAAKAIMAQHEGPYPITATLGLGAKNPAVVFESADLNLAVKDNLKACTSFNGQRCTAHKIVFVHRSVANRFLAAFSTALDSLKMHPIDPDAAITPLYSANSLAYFQGLVKDATDKGAKILNERGGSVMGNAFFPALVGPITPDMTLYNEEQFGPVIPYVIFDRETEILEYAMQSPYGQQVAIYTGDKDQANRMAEALGTQYQQVRHDTATQRSPEELPFGGFKGSGMGVLSVEAALYEFSQPSAFVWKP